MALTRTVRRGRRVAAMLAAWCLIVLAAMPFTAPFSVVDLHDLFGTPAAHDVVSIGTGTPINVEPAQKHGAHSAVPVSGIVRLLRARGGAVLPAAVARFEDLASSNTTARESGPVRVVTRQPQSLVLRL